jgi:hypothetical protein
METIRLSISVPKKAKYDVIVAGGGVAGVAAALSARRAGKRVLVIEKCVTLGGLASTGLINFFVPMCNGRGKIIIRGMAEELLRLSIKHGFDTIPEDWKNSGTEEPAKQRYMTRFSPHIFALELTGLLAEEGIDIRFDSLVTDAVMRGGHCEGLVVESKSGREFFGADMIVDTTGDADALQRAGVPTVNGKNYFIYAGTLITLESCAAAVQSGDISKARVRCYGGGATLYGANHPPEMKLFSGSTGDDVSEFVTLNQLELMKKLREQERFSRDLVELPAMAQFRTTRRIDGDYTLKVTDQYRHFDDSVGALCDFDNRDVLYETPFRTLVRSGFDNIITAGRCASAEGYAWDVLRVIPPAIISGQAAGAAAALAIDSGRPVYEVDIRRLQESLSKAGVMIHFDDSLIPAKQADGAHDDTGHI